MKSYSKIVLFLMKIGILLEFLNITWNSSIWIDWNLCDARDIPALRENIDISSATDSKNSHVGAALQYDKIFYEPYFLFALRSVFQCCAVRIKYVLYLMHYVCRWGPGSDSFLQMKFCLQLRFEISLCRT